MSQTFIRDGIPADEWVAPGQGGCPGCADTLALRLVLKALGPGTTVVMPERCVTMPAEPVAPRALRVPVLHAAPADLLDAAGRARAALEEAGDRETVVLAWADDTLTFGDGLAALSAAAERNEDLLYVCCDHEARMAGGPDAAAVPWGTWTTASPGGALRLHPAKDLIGILAAHRVPYAATGTVAHPTDLLEKARKARRVRGTRVLHVLAPCPTGWECSAEAVVDLARAAVRSRSFPLLEVEDGLRWRLTGDHPGEPIEHYLRRQARFGHLTPEQIRLIQAEVDARWDILRRRVECVA